MQQWSVHTTGAGVCGVAGVEEEFEFDQRQARAPGVSSQEPTDESVPENSTPALQQPEVEMEQTPEVPAAAPSPVSAEAGIKRGRNVTFPEDTLDDESPKAVASER